MIRQLRLVDLLRAKHEQAVGQRDRASALAESLAKRVELLNSGKHVECPKCGGDGHQGSESMEYMCSCCGGLGHVSRELCVVRRLMEK